MRISSILFVLMVSFFSTLSYAGSIHEGFDYHVSAGGQTYPLGGLFTGRAGYGYKFWEGEAPSEGPQWKYSYIRLNLEFATGGIVNRGSVGLEVYPISLLGISGGMGASQRTTTSVVDFNCSEVMCDHVLQYSFLQARLMAGWKNFLFSGTYKVEKFRSVATTKNFYEEMSYLVGQAEQDELRSLNVLAGYKFSDRWTGGFLGIFQRFETSQNNNASAFAVANYTEGFWSGSLGLGQFKSSHQDSRFSALISVTYTGLKSLNLFD